VLGHFHADHAGNIGKFMDSTFVYQRDEIKSAFWPAPGFATFYISGDFEPMRSGIAVGMPNKVKVIELEGDLDLFGDHSVYIHRAVSHTPGSQLVVVRLPKTGTVVLTGDAIYLQENLDKNLLPASAASTIRPACSMPTLGFAACGISKAPTSYSPTIQTRLRLRSTRPNTTIEPPART